MVAGKLWGKDLTATDKPSDKTIQGIKLKTKHTRAHDPSKSQTKIDKELSSNRNKNTEYKWGTKQDIGEHNQ